MKRSSMLCAGLIALGGLGAAATAQAGDQFGDKILALGDSVSFGYIASVGYDYFYTRLENFVGFANELADRLHLELVNASCPGETTGSFLSSEAPDNGCSAYRGLYPLHAAYASTQLGFATAFLRSHREVRLVTITLGANDGLLLEASCANPTPPATVEGCIAAAAPAALAMVADNLGAILADLRGTGYAGPIVLTNYYSTDYSNITGQQITALTADLNSAIAAPASTFGAQVANVFAAFQSVASDPAFGGMTCHTGLLNPDTVAPFACNIHPARSGHALIAATVLSALGSGFLP